MGDYIGTAIGVIMGEEEPRAPSFRKNNTPKKYERFRHPGHSRTLHS